MSAGEAAVLSEPAVLDEPADAGWFEWLLGGVGCGVLFAPLAAMYYFYAPPQTSTLNGSVELVGIAVILRATLRRLFRSGSRSVLQTAVGTVTRASARTMTRRVVRVGVKSLAMFLGRTPAVIATQDDADEDVEIEQTTATATLLGFAALAVSLAGVLLLLDLEQPSEAAGPPPTAEVLGGMSLPTAVLLGAAPLPIYVVLLVAAAPWCGAAVKFRTGWEALLLQAYFTGSGSFLPLSTDSELSGPPTARARLAAVSLGGLFALHLVCWGLSDALDSHVLQYLGGMFLLYCFVFSFPIAPLDGYALWTRSKWLWAFVWIPILASFIWALPESLNVIL